MKRNGLVSIICLILVFMFLFSACGNSENSTGNVDLSDSKYVGTWKATKMTLKDESESLDGTWIVILNGDGTGTYEDKEGSTSITWELTDNGFKTKGDTKLTFTDDGDNIKAKLLGVYVIFERQ